MANQLVLGVAAALVLVGVAAAEEVDSVIDDGTRFATKAAKAPEKFYYGKLYLNSKGMVHTQTNLEGRVTKETKVTLGTFDEKTKQWVAGEPIEGGVAADMFRENGKVLRVRVTVGPDATIRQILVTNTDAKLERVTGEFDAIFKGMGRTSFGGRVAMGFVPVELDENGRVITYFPQTAHAVIKETKVAVGKYNEKEKMWEAGDEIPNGMWGDAFKDPGAKPIFVRITFRDDNRGIAQVLLRRVADEEKK